MTYPANFIESSKITARHLELLAYVYIRQSSPKQVKHNRESQQYQRQMAQRAEALGWSKSKIRIVDTDQALSAKSSEGRFGYKEMVADISLSNVGIIFSYETSRISRKASDWYALMDVASMFGTLIGDSDGVYDPRDYNDRLLLGIKGTLSEAELHQIRSRLDKGRMSQVLRGVYRQMLPTGLVRLTDGTVAKDPDAQVQSVIQLVLDKFAELGSCGKVLRYLVRQGIKLPRKQKSDNERIEWKLPTRSTILDIIRNPAYAGAFVYGRRTPDLIHRIEGEDAPRSRHNSPEQWTHIQQGVYPCYITWDQYLKNIERLGQLVAEFKELVQRSQGMEREGAALLTGAAVCGMCASKMKVSYNPNARYFCDRQQKDYASGYCLSFTSSRIDQAIVRAFFEAIRPTQLNALQSVLASQEAERDSLEQHWQQKIKRAKYEANRAEQQFHAVDERNQLVIAELARRWEEKLDELRSVEAKYQTFLQRPSPASISLEMREQLRSISDTLPTIWSSGKLLNSQKKELLRSFISSVILKRLAPDAVEVRIVWVSGNCSVMNVSTSAFRTSELPRYAEMCERIQALCGQMFSDRQIAAQLTQDGFRSARAESVSPNTVQSIRLENGWVSVLKKRNEPSAIPDYLTIRELGDRIGAKSWWIQGRLRSGKIDPKYLLNHQCDQLWLLKDDPELLEQLRTAYLRRARRKIT